MRWRKRNSAFFSGYYQFRAQSGLCLRSTHKQSAKPGDSKNYSAVVSLGYQERIISEVVRQRKQYVNASAGPDSFFGLRTLLIVVHNQKTAQLHLQMPRPLP